MLKKSKKRLLGLLFGLAVITAPGIPTFAKEAPATIAQNTTVIVNVAALRVRKAANQDADVCGLSARGTSYKVLDVVNNGWIQIAYQGKAAYVDPDYVLMESTKDVNMEQTHVNQSDTVKTIIEVAHLEKKASQNEVAISPEMDNGLLTLATKTTDVQNILSVDTLTKKIAKSSSADVQVMAAKVVNRVDIAQKEAIAEAIVEEEPKNTLVEEPKKEEETTVELTDGSTQEAEDKKSATLTKQDEILKEDQVLNATDASVNVPSVPVDQKAEKEIEASETVLEPVPAVTDVSAGQPAIVDQPAITTQPATMKEQLPVVEEQAPVAEQTAQTTQQQDTQQVAGEQITTEQTTTEVQPEVLGVTIVPVAVSEEDILLLASLIQCEAIGESYEGQVAVGEVVLNRVKSASYPNTVRDVIYDVGQFSPVSSGKVDRVLASNTINENCIQAARDAVNGSSICGGATRFNRVQSDKGLIIGNHSFWGTI